MSDTPRKNWLLPFFLLPFFSFPVYAQNDTVPLKAHYYLFEKDTAIYAVKDTAIVLPCGTKYKIRKDVSAFFVNRFNGRALALFYKPESETTPVNDTVMHIKSENPYLIYQGRIIRTIIIQPLDVTGAKKAPVKIKVQRMLDSAFDAVHITTKVCVIRNNLLFDIGDKLNPYLLADNEKNLRGLPFIQDARIYIDSLTATNDSVDVVVVTKDLWTIGTTVTTNPGDWYRFSIFDANFLGYGQRLQVYAMQYPKRNPHWGEGVVYTKNNVRGSFLDFLAGYSNINGVPRVGPEEEEAAFTQISKPLSLPTTKVTGSLSISLNRSINTFNKPPEQFLRYSCLNLDVWSAFSISSKKSEARRLRKGEGIYLSGRFQHKFFFSKPDQLAELNSVSFNDQWFALSAITFFRQSFYKTRYVSGFGKTEDVAYGHKISVYTGYQYQLFHRRFYAGADAIRQFVTRNGSFSFFRFAIGGFLEGKQVRDILILSKANWYSRVFYLGLTKLRQQFFSAYEIVINPEFITWATINEASGIRGFSSTYVFGRQRIVTGTETTAWLPYPVYGFHIATFVTMEIGQVGMDNDNIFNNRLYSGFGTGFRIKNENLIFKTLEVRMFYYPNAPSDVAPLVFDLSTVIELNFAQSAIQAPSFLGFE